MLFLRINLILELLPIIIMEYHSITHGHQHTFREFCSYRHRKCISSITLYSRNWNLCKSSILMRISSITFSRIDIERVVLLVRSYDIPCTVRTLVDSNAFMVIFEILLSKN